MPAYTIEEHTASDGYRWRYRHYPANPAKAHVVCIHGIQSHAGWYDHSCTRLAEAGYRVSFLDRRGSGMNDEARGDTPGFRRLLHDIAEFLRAKKERCPLFLLGVSWGGKLAAALQRRHPGLVDGLVLLCPGFRPKIKARLRQKLRILWARLVAPSRCFPIPLNEPELFTATPHWQEFLRNDPRMLREATARFFIENVRLDGYLKVVPKHVRIPVLLLLAEHDRIIDNERTRRYVERFATEDQQIIEYAGAHHTLEFEPPPHPYLDDMIRWLDAHTTGSP